MRAGGGGGGGINNLISVRWGINPKGVGTAELDGAAYRSRRPPDGLSLNTREGNVFALNYNLRG